MEYKGRANVEKMGTYSKRLTKAELSKIYLELKGMNLFQYESDYGGPIMDVPRQKFIYTEPGKAKTIVCKMGIPEPLLHLMGKIDSMVEADGWSLEEALPEQQQPVDPNKYDEVIVYINKDFKIKKWVGDYSKYGLNVKKSLSPNGFIWLLNFDNTTITAKELVKLLKDDPDIVNAEVNKQIQMRN